MPRKPRDSENRAVIASLHVVKAACAVSHWLHPSEDAGTLRPPQGRALFRPGCLEVSWPGFVCLASAVPPAQGAGERRLVVEAGSREGAHDQLLSLRKSPYDLKTTFIHTNSRSPFFSHPEYIEHLLHTTKSEGSGPLYLLFAPRGIYRYCCSCLPPPGVPLAELMIAGAWPPIL